MAVQTKVPYRVTEKSLKKWLEQNIGTRKDEAGKQRWSYEVSRCYSILRPWVIA